MLPFRTIISHFDQSSQLYEIRRCARSHVKDTVRRWFVPGNRELSNDSPLYAWERSDMTLNGNFLEVRCNQPSVTTALDPNLVQIGGEARVGCCNMHQSSHNHGEPAYIR
jgi:hypothetical protein